MRTTKRLLTLIIALLLTFSLVQAQELIGEGLSGEELIDYLQQNFQVTNSLGYGDARDVMYGQIDNHDLQLTCVYTSYTIDLDPSQGDPSQLAYAQHINCEHTWPQGMFDQHEPMRSDMHHLFATWETANSARANYQFAEIPDEQTNNWYYNANVSSTPPAEDVRDLASELRSGTSFEPPEAHKGDVARAIFYMWTIYQDRSEFSDDAPFFNGMKDQLLEWHYLDLPDEGEIARSTAIGDEQGNRNPFVHDSTLVRRAYYPEVSSANEMESVLPEKHILVKAWPNPFNAYSTVTVTLREKSTVRLSLYNILGSKVMSFSENVKAAGEHKFTINAGDLPGGMYFLYAESVGGLEATEKIILLK